MDLSIIIPLLNEEESLKELTDWIGKSVNPNIEYEIIFIDDGSTDSSWDVIEDLREQYDEVKAIKFRRNFGKSAALNEGFSSSKGNVVITMDADLQDSPEEINELYRMIANDGYDLVSGWKKVRHDPLLKTIPSKLFNAATRWMSGIQLNDFNCGLKAYKGELARSIEVYGEMHRYLPVMSKWKGYDNIGEKVVQHQARKYGKSKFGLERFMGFLDLLTITFIGKFGKRPMRLFGLWGAIAFIIGGGLFLYLVLDKLFLNTSGKLLADRTEFVLALFCMIMGTMLFLGGFLAELTSRNAPDRNSYTIVEKIGWEE